MEIKEIKEMIRKKLGYSFPKDIALNYKYLEGRMNGIFDGWHRDGKFDLGHQTCHKVIKELSDDFLGYGPISEFLKDKEVTEIMINGPFQIYIEKGGKKYLTDVTFDDSAHLRYIIEKMISPSHRRLDESSPYVDLSLPDGSRVNVIIPPLSAHGAIVTIRKMMHIIEKIEDLIGLGTLDERMAKFLVACIKGRINIIFSGATGSGKTTTVEALSYYIDNEERIITIEDTLELSLRQKHLVRLLTRSFNIEGKGEITARNLFVNSLRMRPSRIILGEIRGEEAMDYLQAINSGHKGSLAVIHASTPLDALMRLETMALYAGLNLPIRAIRKQIASGLNLVVQQEQLIDGSRKITYITEVEGFDNNEIIIKDLFRYDIESMGDDSKKVKGKFIALGVPSFYTNFKKQGIVLKETIFKE